jgi:glycosyltransferase involved in cell wall biosynthesis
VTAVTGRRTLLDRASRPLRIAVVGSAKFGFGGPFGGGLEAHTWDLTAGLRELGHEVTVFAGPGSQPELGAVEMHPGTVTTSLAARRDVSAQPEEMLVEHLAYQRTMLRLMRGRDMFDLVHLNCTHALPVVMAPMLGVPVTTTLHSPPTPMLELAHREVRGEPGAPRTVTVSAHLSDSWRRATGRSFPAIQNGVDLIRWAPGPGAGGYAVWSGRLVPEKAPHLAVLAARRAGTRLVLAGPMHDPAYFDARIRPHLRPDVAYASHLEQPDLARLVGGATVALVTPAWDEPFGLVAAEALACGTPVAAVARGALPDLVTSATGALVTPDPDDDVTAARLAQALVIAAGRDRRRVRAVALERFDLRVMVRGYEELMLGVLAENGADRAADRVSRLPA